MSQSRKNRQDFIQRKSKKNVGDWIVEIILAPILLFIKIASFLIKGRGRVLFGVLLFVFGLVISADSYWQAQNPGFPALSPLGNPPGKQVLGLWESVGLLFTPRRDALLGAIAISTLIQVIEGIAIRKSPQAAKKDLDYYSQFDLGSASSGKIDRAKAAHNDYKRAGMGERTLLGIAAVSCWVVDIIMAFSSNSPMQYWGSPWEFFTCVAINLLKVIAAESGFVLMLNLADRR